MRRGSGRVVLLRGAAGVGKTHLLRRAVELGRESGYEVLEAAGGPLAADATFGVALELLRPLLEGVRDPPRPELAPLLGGDGSIRPDESAPEVAKLTGVALAQLCGERSAERPLLLVVDDIQWADAASLDALEAIARRIESAPTMLLAGLREGEPDRAGAEALALLTGELLGQAIEVRPFDRDAVVDLLELNGVEVEGEQAALRLARMTGGNALLVTRVAAILRERGEAASVPALGRIGTEDAVDVAASVTSQLQRLGAEAGEVAELVSVLGEHARWRHIVAVSDLDRGQVEEALDRLAAAGLLEAGEPVTFTHPLVREAVYRTQTPSRKARRHVAAARRLIEEEADPEQVSSHLLLAPGEGSQDFVAQLISAARQAMRRGVPSTAVAYLERALAEPPSGDDRARTLILLGWVLAQLGREDADRPFIEARQATEDARLRAEADLGLGRFLYARGDYAEAESVLERGRAELGPDAPHDEGLVAECQAAALAAARYAGTLSGREDERLRRLLEGDAPGAGTAERALLAELAAELGVRGEPRERVISLALRAWADGEMLLTADRHGISISQVAAALVWSDAYAEAEEMLNTAARHCAAIGARTGQATARYMRGWVRLYRGDFAGAIADGRAALRADGWSMYVPPAAAIVAHCMVELADLGAAEEALQLPGGDEQWSATMPFALALEARGRIAMARGDVEGALESLDACAELCLPLGEHHPFSHWRSRKALCLNELGERRAALALIEEEIAPCRRAGAPRPLGIALTAAGMIEGGERGVELIGEAASVLAGSGAVVEHARALTELGFLLRRLGRDVDARRPLREALALADGIGAVALTEHAAAELTAAGGRPRRRAITGPDSLTPAERRTARLAAVGQTNREIAEQLVVTTKTVQFHLSNAYRKLGISSREELEDVL